MSAARVEMKRSQLFCLFVIQHAANETWKDVAGSTPNAHIRDGDQSLTPFQKYLCKLAEVAQTEKGGETISALVCLRLPDKEGGGAKFLLTSNHRRDDKLAKTTEFLKGLLEYAALNPDKLKQKPLQKQILSRVIEFDIGKFKCYLQLLLVALEACIKECEYDTRSTELGIQAQLKGLRTRATFPQEIEHSQNAKSKFMKSSDTLVKAIEVSKDGGIFESWLGERASSESPPAHWTSLRHHLGRIHSFRRAAASIAEAPSEWPDLFKNFSFDFIPSAAKERPHRIQPTNMLRMFSIAFPDSDISEFTGLEGTDFARTLANTRIESTMIHAEVNLHPHLVDKGYVEPANFWEGSPFIATSKPPCQSCHYYFKVVDNHFQVQATNMNLYPKCRLPSGCSEEILDDILLDMQDETRRVLRTETANYTRYDSRTDSATRMSTLSAGGSRVHSRLSHPSSTDAVPRSQPTSGSIDTLGGGDDTDWVGVRMSGQHVSLGFNEGHGIGTAV